MEVNASLRNCVDFFSDGENLKKINDKVAANDTIEELNDDVRIVRREMKGNLIVSNRDLALFWQMLKLEDGSVVLINFSIETDKIPETKCVRAEQDFFVMHFKPISSSK